MEAQVSPFQTGNYLPGELGVREFTDNLKQGFAIRNDLTFYGALSFYDKNGYKLEAIDDVFGNELTPVNVDIFGFQDRLFFSYVSESFNFLGNDKFQFSVAPSFSSANISVGFSEMFNVNVEGGGNGFGDLRVQPFLFAWNNEKTDYSFSYTFFAPTGKFEIGGIENTGTGHWSHVVQGSVNFYSNDSKRTSFLVMPSYEFHGKLKDAEVTPSDRIFLEYGLSHYFNPRWELMVQGGHAWQISEDKGDGVYWDASVKDRMSMYAVGLAFKINDAFYLQAKGAGTYGVREFFRYDSFQFQLQWNVGK